MLDPGHGGIDPGAISDDYPNIFEKDINLTIARLIRRYLLQTFEDVHPDMTRMLDEYKSLSGRVSIANFEAPELFVSFHCNARPIELSEVVGFEIETYWYKPEDKIPADVIHQFITSELNAIDRGVKTQPFYVLKNTCVPAILLELGFVTDSDDIPMLTLIENQRKIARIVGNGIDAFMHFKKMTKHIDGRS